MLSLVIYMPRRTLASSSQTGRLGLRCKKEFMDLRNPTREAAIRRAVGYLTRSSVDPTRRMNQELGRLRSACAATQFSSETCRVPLHIPLRHTIPVGGVQYVLGRVDTLDVNGYNNLQSSCIKVLNLGYSPTRPGELTWDIMLNDVFIACGAASAYAFGQFPIRLVVDPIVFSSKEPSRLVKRVNHVDQAVRTYTPREALDKLGLRNYRAAEQPSVTVREICQLLYIFGMRMYKYVGRDWTGQYDMYFFSNARRVPPAFRMSYVAVQP